MKQSKRTRKVCRNITIPQSMHDKIVGIARVELRNFSNQVEVLIAEAIAAREDEEPTQGQQEDVATRGEAK